jgi:hypothetical protein
MTLDVGMAATSLVRDAGGRRGQYGSHTSSRFSRFWLRLLGGFAKSPRIRAGIISASRLLRMTRKLDNTGQVTVKEKNGRVRKLNPMLWRGILARDQ